MAGGERDGAGSGKALKEAKSSNHGHGTRGATTKSIMKGQSTLDANMKKVHFEQEKTKEEERRERADAERRLSEEISKLREEKVEIEKIKVELQKKNVELHERVVQSERRMEEIEKRMSEFEDALNECKSIQKECKACCCESVGGESGEERGSVRSRDGSVQSRASVFSIFSDYETRQIKRMLTEKDRTERRDNIVIKGANFEAGNLAKGIEDWIKTKLGIEVNILSAWARGTIVVAKLGNAEQKLGIMRNKNKLTGSKIFIENDLTWDERKRQEEIIRWAREQKEKGRKIKIGYGKVQIRDTWIKWEDWKKEEQDKNEIRRAGSINMADEGREQGRVNEEEN